MSKKSKTPWDSEIYFDGGSRGNPGVAAGAAIIKYQDEVYHAEKFLPHATVNEAEYTGCIVGLEKALELGCKYVKVYGDSQLVINHLVGFYEVKALHLKPLYEKAKILSWRFIKCHFQWVRREENQDADAICNECMDENTGITFVREQSVDLPVCEPIPALAEQITEIIKMGDKVGFSHFKKLKSGNDKLSRVRLPALIESVPAPVWELIQGSITEGEEWQTKALRWYLRGLPVDQAIYKIKVDYEISSNAIRARN